MVGLEVNTPTAGGLSAADLIAILSIVVVLFGLLLTAIGVLVLRQFTGQDERLQDVKKDLQEDIRDSRRDAAAQFTAVWAEVRFLRSWLRAPDSPLPPPGHGPGG